MKKIISSFLILMMIASTSLMAKSNKLEADHQFIKKMAEEIGEYFHYDNSEYRNYIYPISRDNIPESIDSKIYDLVRNRVEIVRDYDISKADTNSAELAGDQYKIIKDGQIIGYVIHIMEYIEHPLWDGSGVHIYIDIHGKVIQSIDWVG